ncbi:MAG: hypothetical protein ACT4NL_17085 [Pseudomarimonas sp.]
MLHKRAALAACMLIVVALAFLGGVKFQQTDMTTTIERPSTDTPEPDAALGEVDDLDATSELGPMPATDSPTAQAESKPPQPLPPLHTKVADVFEELAERGKRGDADAACRLAAELVRCNAAHMSQGFANDAEQDLARRPASPEQAVAQIARAQQFSESIGKGCDGLSRDQLASAFDWQRQAALLDPSLRLALVLQPALDRRNFLGEFDRWAEYRRLALPWLEEAARAGDAAAVIALARIYGDHRMHVMLPPQFRIQDDERFVQYAELMDRYGVGLDVVRNAAAEARARLSPEVAARAELRADAMFNADVQPLDSQAVDKAHGASLRSDLKPERCGDVGTLDQVKMGH